MKKTITAASFVLIGCTTPQNTERACEETARSLARLEQVDRGSSVFEYSNILEGRCVIVINAPFQGESATYSTEGARARLNELMKKHGVIK